VPDFDDGTMPVSPDVEAVPFEPVIEEFDVPAGSRPHDVAPAVDGGVWYTAQRLGALGYLDTASGLTQHVHLGAGAAPHGVIVDPDGPPGSPTADSTPSSASIR
jgi:streptogramin lyase